MITRTRSVTLGVLACTLVVFARPVYAESLVSDSPGGMHLLIKIEEILEADVTEKAWIDSVEFPVYFDVETTLRAGNAVFYLTARPDGSDAVRLSVTAYVTGPVPGHQSDEARVEWGTPLVIAGIKGKGKSHYNAHLIPFRAELPGDPGPIVSDSSLWLESISTFATYYLPRGILEEALFLPYRRALDYEFETVRDSLGLKTSGKLFTYLSRSAPQDMPCEPGRNFAVDPSRYRVAMPHHRFHSSAESPAMILAASYRLLGYAPDLIALGSAGGATFADYWVKKDHEAGKIIPLDSLARSIDFRRHDHETAFHHAASFVGWLRATQGRDKFLTLYDRATDLSLPRAIWSVYGQTLAELEGGWLSYLRQRGFYREEYQYFAERERLYHRFGASLELYQRAADAGVPAPANILNEIAITQAHLGRWQDVTSTLELLASLHPEEKGHRWFLAEAMRAAGDDVHAERLYTMVAETDSTDPRPLLRQGEIQWEARRADSAAALWRRGMSRSPGPRITCELALNLGEYFAGRRKGRDSANAWYAASRRAAGQMIGTAPIEASGWLLTAEALLGLDSAESALEHLRTAEALTDAVIEQGRIFLLQGKCYDKLRKRGDATAAYERVFTIPAEAPVQRAARRYLNRPFGR